jgi:hypothetical protein
MIAAATGSLLGGRRAVVGCRGAGFGKGSFRPSKAAARHIYTAGITIFIFQIFVLRAVTASKAKMAAAMVRVMGSSVSFFAAWHSALSRAQPLLMTYRISRQGLSSHRL